MKRKKVIFSILFVVVGAVTLTLLTGKRVLDNAMCASICKGDWIWINNQKPEPGDVVLLNDPLNPEENIIRRVIGLPGQTLQYGEDGDIVVDKKRIRQLDMGFYKDRKLVQENTWSSPPTQSKKWLTLRLREPLRQKSIPQITLNQGEYFVLADNRDNALDSRWWGPINENLILGKLIIRVGEPNTWRERWEIHLQND